MFELKQKDVLLSTLTTRTEKNGDEDVPAASLRCEITMSNQVLEMFSPKLLSAFYEKRDKAQGELIQDDMLKDLKFSHIKPIKWDAEYENYRVILVNDLEPSEARFILADCTLKNFVFELEEGGSVSIQFTINCHPTGEAVAWLYEQQKYNVLMTLEAPEPAQLEDLAEGFGAMESTNEGLDVNRIDELFGVTIDLFRKGGSVSISGLQRHYQIGYNRAANLIEQLASAGWVSPPDAQGGRTFIDQDDEAAA